MLLQKIAAKNREALSTNGGSLIRTRIKVKNTEKEFNGVTKMGADSFMMLVVLAVILSPFLPIVLKSKCPVCNKRKLEHLETVNMQEADKKEFVTLYRCHNCKSDFERVRSGPLQLVEPEGDTLSAEQVPA